MLNHGCKSRTDVDTPDPLSFPRTGNRVDVIVCSNCFASQINFYGIFLLGILAFKRSERKGERGRI